jgi:DNA-binding Lrp family transcriptional regulator
MAAVTIANQMSGKDARIPVMDELDAEITRLLQADARQSNRELARRLGVAPSTCLERVRALTRRGVIRGYHADVDLKALNRGVQALIAVQVRPLRRSVIDAFKDSVGQLPEVLTVFVLAGGDDFLLHVAVPDLDHLHGFLLDRLSKRGEIVGFRTSVIYQRVHNTILTRLPDHARQQPSAGGST